MKTTQETAEVGVIVARFQCPLLHEGHIDIINQVRANHPRVIIFLGVSPLKCTKKKPYDFSIRKWMVEEKYPDIEVYPIDDVGDDGVWSRNLDDSIKKYIGPNLKVVLYGSRDSFLKSYKGHYPTLELVAAKYISASDIRKSVGIKAKRTQEFREGIVHAIENQYTSCKATVDVAIVGITGKRVLLARKPGQEHLRFVGGFSDVKSPSYEADAIRETKEETNLTISNPQYLGSSLIDDWRFRDEEDKIKTLFFIADYEGGVPKAQDDIAELEWVPFEKLSNEIIMPEHHPLMDMFKKWIADHK